MFGPGDEDDSDSDNTNDETEDYEDRVEGGITGVMDQDEEGE